MMTLDDALVELEVSQRMRAATQAAYMEMCEYVKHYERTLWGLGVPPPRPDPLVLARATMPSTCTDKQIQQQIDAYRGCWETFPHGHLITEEAWKAGK